MRYRSLFLFSSFVALAIAGCSSDSDDSTASAGASGKGGAGGTASGGTGGQGAGTGGTMQPGSAGESAGGQQAGAAGSAGAAGETGGEAGAAGEDGVKPFLTLDGSMPLVIGHRGLPGLHPEETQVSYEAAADAGADSLEEDLHLTKDCVLVARHNPWLSDNTNITAVAATNATIAARKRTKAGEAIAVLYDSTTVGGPATYLSDANDPLHELVVDGEDHVGDWSITDFTVAELKEWLGGTTFDDAAERPTAENGLYPILTMQEIIAIQKAKAKATGRVISVYPEAKNPYWNNEQAKANGCGTGDHPFEDAIVKLIKANDLNTKDSPIFVQSFDPASLIYMRSIGLATKAVQLIDADDYDLKTGKMIYVSNDKYNFIDGRPYSWTVTGKPDTFGDMLTPAGLTTIKTYADGIGPWKPQVMSWKVSPYPTTPGFSPTLPGDVNTVTSTGLVDAAHSEGLFVHVYTFRNETKYLAEYFHGDPEQEFLTFFRQGVDGVFTDFANTGVAARALYLTETGH
jgi:glycerophosphoryl diester phosphodiesterase